MKGFQSDDAYREGATEVSEATRCERTRTRVSQMFFQRVACELETHVASLRTSNERLRTFVRFMTLLQRDIRIAKRYTHTFANSHFAI